MTGVTIEGVIDPAVSSLRPQVDASSAIDEGQLLLLGGDCLLDNNQQRESR
jgi:hypothetical protein